MQLWNLVIKSAYRTLYDVCVPWEQVQIKPATSVFFGNVEQALTPRTFKIGYYNTDLSVMELLTTRK